MRHQSHPRLSLALAILLLSACAVAADGPGRGFTAERRVSGVRGFDNARGGAGGGESDKAREWAREYLKSRDENGDGHLTESETRRWSRMAAFDHDGDKRISLDELTAFSSGKPLPKRKALAVGAERTADGRRSQRLWTAVDKLPEGLPSWFTEKDANRDGQVAMHEYSRRWDAGTVRRFTGYDANDDGLITPAEALAGR